MASEPDSSVIEIATGIRRVVVYAMSDLHVDESPNSVVLDRLVDELEGDSGSGSSSASGEPEAESAFRLAVVAGDVARRHEDVGAALLALVAVFDAVVYVPGNNELRLSSSARGSGMLSTEAFEQARAAAARAGAIVDTAIVGDVLVVPLAGWHSAHFDGGKHFTGDVAYQRRFLDFRATRWPSSWPSASLDGAPDAAAEYFAQFNAGNMAAAKAVLQRRDKRISALITASHFLPRLDVLPWRARTFMSSDVVKVIGDDRIEDQIRELHTELDGEHGTAHVHVSGHVHINHNKVCEGVRYLLDVALVGR
ncbi:Ser/Thr protein phosphatase family protein [Thecamonas trahens ATCC 50062]|uniref:Ser/Thr protein phosphatase family protein n=1 Tax=Thecamonas trahens ATCC 50062 TaxID=461836 RepID=A0A0L0DIT8_THETB|nr:Ser/Thr protein phosphatase family protein [Thecamonas trahens ATCC 50062]KNC52021.1 Ser/Thr protein phosphatase family protein [Thecamonas trahens ATCC 50062]|eukprot:XP_013755604.1 Ser/Thr protein phosphatase family protein [Thecamonas trahens ATCC 50062]